MKINVLIIIIFLTTLFSCDSSSRYAGPSPVDIMMRDMNETPAYSIILHDMQMDEEKDVYQHKYKVIKNPLDSTSKGKITEWKKVDEVFFAENLDNMGMELAGKTPDGKVHKVPSPPGYNGYVGNEKYGNWQQDNNGNSFWAFYGRYAFMSSMFNMMAGPTYRSSYRNYRSYRGNPSTRSKPYYGSGANRYGTSSPHARRTNPSFFQRKQQQRSLSSFRQKVSRNPSRYTRRSSSRSTRSRSTSRSRGGGFGK